MRALSHPLGYNVVMGTGTTEEPAGATGEAAPRSAPVHLSPSSAAMFAQCPKRWRFRYLDRLPDPPGAAALVGTLPIALGMTILGLTEALSIGRAIAVRSGQRIDAKPTAQVPVYWVYVTAWANDIALAFSVQMDAEQVARAHLLLDELDQRLLDRERRGAFRPRGADVVFLHHLDDRGPHHARDHRGIAVTHRRRGPDQLREVGDRIDVDGRVGDRRQPVEEAEQRQDQGRRVPQHVHPRVLEGADAPVAEEVDEADHGRDRRGSDADAVAHAGAGRDADARSDTQADAADVYFVPGAYELPFAAKKLTPRYDAIVALGAVVRGDTPHFDYVAGECARGLQQVMLETGVPVIFGVLTTNTWEQAQDRAGGKHGNKGYDAAMTAVEMALFGK